MKPFRNQLLAPANIFFISAIFFFLSSEKIQAYDIAVWPSFSQPAAEIVSYSGPNAIFLDDKHNPYKLNVRTRTISRLAGRFKELQTDGKGGLWALSPNGSVYSFTDPIWKKFKTGKKIDTFSVTEKMVLCVSNGTVTIFGRLGEIYANQRLQKTEGISSIFAQNSNEFIFLTKDGKLGKITKTAESTIDRGVKDILFFTTRYFGIKKKDGQIFVYYKKQNRLERIRIEDTANILSITLNNDGYLLASNGNNIFLSPFTITELIKGEDKRVFSKKLNFIKLKATASRIFSGPKGIFRNTPTGELQVWSNSKRKFQSFPGRVVQLSVTGNQELWGLTRLGRIFHFQTGKWNQKRGVAGSISSRGRHVLIVDHKNNVRRYNWKTKKFKSNGIRAQSVYVQNQLRFWAIGLKGEILQCSRKCRKIRGRSKKLSISPEGVVFSIDKKGKLLRYNGRKFEFVKTKFGLVTDLAATTGGGVWLLDQYNNIFITSGSLKSDNSTNFLSYNVQKTSVKNQTVGSGTALLNGRKLTSRELKLSADAPNGGFIFKEKMRRKTISNFNFFKDLSMGRNGKLWALTSTKVFQYHEKKKRFKPYDKANFNQNKQEYLRLPVGVTVSSIISDRDDKLWIIKKNSKTLYWQKKRKGKYTSTNLPPFAQNITDITIDIIGNVYVAAGEIYKWNYQRRKFDSFFKRGGPYQRLSSGPPGTLWAVNDKGQIFEFVSGRLEKRPRKGKFTGQDIDISVDGTIYATSPTKEEDQPLCYLRKYNPLSGGFLKTGRSNEHYSQFVAVASDGTPWMTCAPVGSNNVYRGD